MKIFWEVPGLITIEGSRLNLIRPEAGKFLTRAISGDGKRLYASYPINRNGMVAYHDNLCTTDDWHNVVCEKCKKGGGIVLSKKYFVCNTCATRGFYG